MRSVLTCGALWQLGTRLPEVPGDQLPDHFGAAGGDEEAQPVPQGFGHGDGNAKAMPVFLRVCHKTHRKAWLAAKPASLRPPTLRG